jgi:carbonic anhydrase
MAHPTRLSKDQIARFGSIYQNNARPVQALNGRQVQLSQ